MDKIKFYVEPLGPTGGLTVSTDKFLNLGGGSLNFAALRIITRDGNKITTETLSAFELQNYLSHQSNDKRQKISALLKNISCKRLDIELRGGHVLKWDKPIIQGVLNITPDSFSDGGNFDDFEKSFVHAEQMIASGAGIIDVGGESTKPGAVPVSIDAEKERVLPIINELSSKNIPISIDSRNADVMEVAIKAGADIINDVSALEHDERSVAVLKEMQVPVILMHTQGNPENMQEKPEYDCAVLDIYDYLKRRIEFCLSAGISKDKIIIDPGIGFGKTVSHNLQILKSISLFHGLGVAILVGVSRKSFIGKITGEEVAAKRISGSIAAAQFCLDQGVQIIRVHDVEETNQAVSIWKAIMDENEYFH